VVSLFQTRSLTMLTEIVVAFDETVLRGELLSLSASEKGHDAALVEDGFVGIADGSTPLVITDEIDAHRYAHDSLVRLKQHRETPPTEMFRRALSTAAQGDTPISQVPSSTVITLTAIGGELTVSALGDCLGVVRASDGALAVVQDHRLEPFDGPIAAQMARDVAQGMTVEEARKKANAQLVINRDRANSRGTYWLFVDDPAAAEHISVESMALADVEQVLICSDGFSRLIEPFRIAPDAEGLLRLAGELGLGRLGDLLRSAEEAPQSFVDFPRLDISDDATAIFLRRD
jgi:hypothetical protein